VDIREFYSTSWIAESLVEQFDRRFITLRFDHGMRRHYDERELQLLRERRITLWRLMDKPFFEIHQALGDRRNPVDLAYYLDQGVVEFIPEVSTIYDLNRTDTIIIDLDPKNPNLFDFEDTRGATKVVDVALCGQGSVLTTQFNVIDRKYRFSGNRSFHIYIRLDKPHHFEPVREAVKASLDVVTKMYPVLSYKNLRAADGSGRDDYILVDIGALSRHRCVRSLWSVHAKTLKACVPVENLDSFQRETATLEAVLARGRVEEKF